MKKFVFALEMMSLMLVLPVYMVVELNHPTTATEIVIDVKNTRPGDKPNTQAGAGGNLLNSALVTGVTK